MNTHRAELANPVKDGAPKWQRENGLLLSKYIDLDLEPIVPYCLDFEKSTDGEF
jgi:hypothetical protein